METRILFSGDYFGANSWECIPYLIAPYCSCQCGSGGGGGGGSSGAAPGLLPFAGSNVGGEPTKVALEDPNATGGLTTTKFAGLSDAPVRYSDGMPVVNAVDLSSDAFGKLWGQSRSYSEATISGPMGNHWVDPNMPFLFRPDGDGTPIVAVTSGTDTRWFDYQSGTGRYSEDSLLGEDTLTNATVSGVDYWTLTDTSGGRTTYYGFDTAYPGQFCSYTDADGNVTAVVSHDADGQITEVQRGAGSVIESWVYHYNTTEDPGQELIDHVTLRQSRDGGSTWQTVQQVAYTYYDGTTAGGSLGDLASATVEDASGTAIDQTDYRYWKSGETATAPDSYGDPASPDTPQQEGELKAVFDDASIARAEAAGYDPFADSDADLAPYATNQYTYYEDNSDGEWHVYQEVAAGAGASASGGQGTTTFLYGDWVTEPGCTGTEYSRAAYKTEAILPSGGHEVVYCNQFGETLLKVSLDASGTITSGEYYQYDDAGRLVLHAEPSAMNLPSSLADLEANGDLVGYNASTGAYEYLNESSGLIERTCYYGSTSATSTTAGGVAGYVDETFVQQGYDGTRVAQEKLDYVARSDGSGTTIYPVADDTVYGNDDGTDARTTSYSYTWYTGTVARESMTTTLPTISSGQNGPGSADQVTTYFDTAGRPVWTKDGNGSITYTQYDAATGAVTKVIQDVDTSLTSEFSGLPSGWSTPVGGGANLITTYEVDGLGRTTKETSPNGNVTYTVYNDAAHEVRVYPGFSGTAGDPTGTTTGPITVYRTYYAQGSGELVYYETLTSSAAPTLNDDGTPAGTETLDSSNIQSLSRQLTNDAGQVVEEDDYFSLAGVTYSQADARLGTASNDSTSGNYHATLYGYNDSGKLSRVQAPTGTITRTVYDDLGRVSSTWVGTDDTGATDANPAGSGSPNNMVDTEDYQYDSVSGSTSGWGDGNLTRVIQHPGDGQADRVTDYYYDWRDRLVASKTGVKLDGSGDEDPSGEDTTTGRLIRYETYDNLDEIVQDDLYAGAGVGITYTDGVPNAPSASDLRARTTVSFDDQGRAYRTSVFSVDPITGDVSTDSLDTNTFYDHAGQVIDVVKPGGLATKYAYDGAGRVVTQYTTDGGATNAGDGVLQDWSDAASVADDVVIEQTEYQYDGDGNVIATTTRQRFHDDPTSGATGLGALQGPASTTGPKARAYYQAFYYDAADRLTDSVDVGTNGGTAYSRPGTAPTASTDALYLTHTHYNAAGLADAVTDPRGITSLTFYDLLGRTTRTVAAWDGSSDESDVTSTPTVGNANDQVTDYAYDGDGHLIKQKAWNHSGAATNAATVQATDYVYGVTQAGGSAIDSNDLLATVEYPDHTTGAASNSATNSVSLTYLATGDQLTKTDQNGSTHTYGYDALGRLTSDDVTTLGAGVSNLVLGIVYTFNDAGLPLRNTSYGNTAHTVIRTSEQFAYDGFGNLTSDEQDEPNINPAPSEDTVQYVYDFSDNHDRLAEVIYPDGRVLHYGYDNSTLDDAISRPDYLADDDGSGGIGTHLVDYSYLGLGTAVQESHPEIGVSLTYFADDTAATSNPSNTGGDQYTGLDQFGRVVDQDWVDTTTGAPVDRYQYGYDRDGNVLYSNNLGPGSGAADYSALYHANSTSSGDDADAYDALNRLTDFSRGALSSSGNNGSSLDTVASATDTESWTLDGQGNWTSEDVDGTTTNRTADPQNEESGLTYDNNGNALTDGSGNTYTYDAWNRLTSVQNGSLTMFYYYMPGSDNAAARGTVTGSAIVGTAMFYSQDGQLLQETDLDTGDVTQYVWGLTYVNDLVLRDRNADGDASTGGYGASGSGLEERLYALRDANHDVTAVYSTGAPGAYNASDGSPTVIHLSFTFDDGIGDVYHYTGSASGSATDGYGGEMSDQNNDQYDVWVTYADGQYTVNLGNAFDDSVDYSATFTLGSDGHWTYVGGSSGFTLTDPTSPVVGVAERFSYDPYGDVTTLDGSWNATSDALQWNYLFQGGRKDPYSGLYQFGARDYSATLGRWVQQDPAGYVDAASLYQFVRSDPENFVDARGLKGGVGVVTGPTEPGHGLPSPPPEKNGKPAPNPNPTNPPPSPPTGQPPQKPAPGPTPPGSTPAMQNLCPSPGNFNTGEGTTYRVLKRSPWPTTQSCTPTTQSSGPTTQPSGPTTQPSGPTTQPSGPTSSPQPPTPPGGGTGARGPTQMKPFPW